MRILLSIVAQFDLDHDSLDVKTAFLYPTLKPEDKAWLKRPAGLTDNDMPAIVELIKSLYGLPKTFKYFREFLANELIDKTWIQTNDFRSTTFHLGKRR